MNLSFVTLLFLSAIFSPVQARMTLNQFSSSLKKFDVSTLSNIDMCSNKTINSSKKASHVIVWSINCGNCLQEIEDMKSKLDETYLLLNVDTEKKDIKSSCRWLKKNNIPLLSLNDKGLLKNHLKENYPIPISLNVSEGIVMDVTFGYWRSAKDK